MFLFPFRAILLQLQVILFQEQIFQRLRLGAKERWFRVRAKNTKILDNFIWHGRAQQWYARACKLPRANTSPRHRHDPCLQWHGRATPPDSFLYLVGENWFKPFNLIHGSLLKMWKLKYLILSVKVCKSIWKLKIMKRTHFVFYQINYICFHIEFLPIRWVWQRECIFKMLFWAWSCSSINWNFSVGRVVGLSSKEYIRMHLCLS